MATLAIRINENEKKRLETLAAKDDRTMSYVVRKLIQNFLASKSSK